MVAGFARVTGLILQCSRYQSLYLSPDSRSQLPDQEQNALQRTIIRAYVDSLRYLGFAIHSQNSRSKAISAPFRLDDIKSYIETLIESGHRLASEAENCDKLRGKQHQAELKELQGLTEDLQQAVREQMYYSPASDRLKLTWSSTISQTIHQEFCLSKLLVADGAAYDHLANQHEPMCHPETRVDVIKRINEWVDSPDGRHIFWLMGKAGTGKSTISRTVAHGLAKKGILGASFFFKRGAGDRSNATRFCSTLVAQLIQKVPLLAPYVQKAIETRPDVINAFLRVQFEELIVQPWKQAFADNNSPDFSTMVIVTDALDECDPEQDAASIIGLLPLLEQQIYPIRVKIFVTSRPEIDIRLAFSRIRLFTTT